jgi:hemoglobin-like flavoprotein
VSLLKKSYRQFEPLQIAALFYDKLFERYPDLKHMFPTDHSELMTKLMGVLELVVFSFEEKTNDRFSLQESMIIPLRDLGKKHDDRGVMPEHYTIANDLLLESIHEKLGNDFTDPIRESWSVALHILSAAMQDESVDSQIINRSSNSVFQGNFRQLFNEFKKRISHPQ